MSHEFDLIEVEALLERAEVAVTGQVARRAGNQLVLLGGTVTIDGRPSWIVTGGPARQRLGEFVGERVSVTGWVFAGAMSGAPRDLIALSFTVAPRRENVAILSRPPAPNIRLAPLAIVGPGDTLRVVGRRAAGAELRVELERGGQIIRGLVARSDVEPRVVRGAVSALGAALGGGGR
jgi:hypothetical protein